MKNRREVLKFTAKVGLLALAGGFAWQQVARANTSLVLRPPGAKPEGEFLASCIRCGLCVVACPFKTLKLADVGEGFGLGTPFFTPREVPCYMCPSVPCAVACPTDALNLKLLQNGEKTDIKKAKMGVAVLDAKNCVAHWGIQCDACYRACPLIDRAIKLEYKRNERTSKHSFLLPVIDSDVCTGCGICERVCITQKAAIFVLPRDLALGQVADNYIKGWDADDENRVKNAPKTPNLNQEKAIDYLNGEL